MRRRAAGAWGIFAAVLAAYAPVWRAGFVWNDPDYVTRSALRSWQGLARIWTDVGATEQYYPLLHSLFWVQHRLWGNAALGYHLANVGAHAACACALWAVLAEVMGNSRSAWLAAMLFAVHPVMAESVAWISEQKNTFSLGFYLLAGWLYLRNRPGWGLAAFAAALACKTVTATLPAALLVVCWWKGAPLRQHWRRLLPWFGLAAAAGLFSAWVERTYVGAHGTEFELSLVQRILLAARIPWFYLGKLLWPAHLVFIYAHWTIDARSPAAWAWLAATAAALATAAWVAWKWRRRGPLAAALFFVGSLFPTLGIFNVYAFVYSYVADHWTYLPSLAIFAAAGWGLSALAHGPHALAGRVPADRPAGTPGAGPAQPSPLQRPSGRALRARRQWRERASAAASAFLLVTLGCLTWKACEPYRDALTFYRTIVERNPGAWMAQNNLGDLLAGHGRPADALPFYQAALAARPDLAETHDNFGVALAKAGRDEEAAAQYREALRLKPDYAAARLNLGLVLLRQRNFAGAAAALESAIAIQPAYARADITAALAEADNNTGVAALERGDAAAALAEFALAVKLQPAYAAAWANQGRALAAAGRLSNAIPSLETALRLAPRSPETENDLGAILARTGNPAAAIPHYESALRLRPEFPAARQNLDLAKKALQNY